MSGPSQCRGGIRIRTPARLHLGIFDLPAGGYGGIGLALQMPNVEMCIALAAEISGDGPQARRAVAAARRFYATHIGLNRTGPNLQRNAVPRGADIRIQAVIPPHVGLGSGTQLELAVHFALSKLHGLPTDLDRLALAAGRAGRSKVGIEAFRRGGCVIHAALDLINPVTLVEPFPSHWHFVVAVPRGAQGLFGKAEERAFRVLPAMPRDIVQLIHRLIRSELIPSLKKAEIIGFGRALSTIQAMVGDHFAGSQGGRYSHPLAPEIVAVMLRAGAAGVAQSSWGPAVCGLVPAGKPAEQVATAVRIMLARRADAAGAGAADIAAVGSGEADTGEVDCGAAGEVFIAAPDNIGAFWEWTGCG